MALSYGTMDFIEGAVISAVIVLNIVLGYVVLLHFPSTLANDPQIRTRFPCRKDHEVSPQSRGSYIPSCP